MATRKLKSLHMAKSLEELNKKISSDKTKSATPKQLCKSAEKVFLKAKDLRMDGDEEMAYVLFMRFMDVFEKIMKSKEYKTNKNEFDKLLPKHRAIQALEEAENLSKSLTERYLSLSEPAGKRPKIDSEYPQGNPTGTSEDDQVVPSSPSGQPLSAQDVYKQSQSSPLIPQLQSTDMVDSDDWFGLKATTTVATASKSTKLPTLSSQELYDHLRQSPEEVLVLDCRMRADYVTSHVDGKKFPQWLSVPEETVRRGVSSESIMKFLTGNGKKIWKEREKKSWIVLVDENSTAERLGKASNGVPILTLKDAVHKWDTSVHLVREPFLLEGGYAMWYLTYPTLCVGAYKRKEENSTGSSKIEGPKPALTLDYPNFPTLSEPSSSRDESTAEHPAEPPSMAPPVSSPPLVDQTPAVFSTQPSPMPTYPPHTMDTVTPSALLPMLPSYGPPPPAPLGLEGDTALLAPTLTSDEVPNMAGYVATEAVFPSMEQETAAHIQQPGSTVGYVPHPVPLVYEPVPISQEQPPFSQSMGQQQLPYSGPDNRQMQVSPQLQECHVVPPPTSSYGTTVPLQGNATFYPQQQIQQNGGGEMVQQNMYHMEHPQQPHPQAQHLQQPLPQAQHPQAQHPQQPLPQAQHPHAQHLQQPHPQAQHPQQPLPQAQHLQQPHPQTQHPQQSLPQAQHLQQPLPQAQHPQQPHPQAQHLQQPLPQAQHLQQPHPHVQPPQQPLPQAQHPQAQYLQQPHPHAQHMQQPLPQAQHLQQPHPQPQHMQQPLPQAQHLQQPHPPAQHLQQPHPQAQHLQQPLPQAQFPQQPYPSAIQGPPPDQNFIPPQQPHPSAIQGPPPDQNFTLQQQPFPSTIQGPPSNQNFIPPQQPHPSTIQGPLSSQNFAPPQQQHNPRVVNGPIPAPPTYNDALPLPSHPPVQPPLPPPVSLTQSGQQSSHTHPWAVQSQSGSLESQEQASLESKKDARIQELEQQLAEKEREKELSKMVLEDGKRQQQEQLQREMEVLEHRRVALQQEQERERARLEQEKALHHQQLEREKQELAREREENQRTFQELKAQFEREKLLMEQKKDQMNTYWQLKQQQDNQRTFAVSQGLPPGWEKRLDSGTGRFYYVDHSTKTTHWNPPTNWLTYQAEAQKQRELQERAAATRMQLPPAPQQAPISPPTVVSQSRPGTGMPLTPSSQTPSDLQPRPQVPSISPQRPSGGAATTTPQAKVTTPVVDRSTKPQQPSAIPVVDRSSKPMNVALHRKKVENLQPVFGSAGYALTGLRNLGNTCFMNSCLQCLSNTTPLMEYFISGRFRKDVNRTNPLGMHGELAEEYNFLVKSMWSGQYRSISPRDFKWTISKFAPQFSGSQQQDSQEFLAFFLDGLHEDLNRVQVKRYIEEKDNSGIPPQIAAETSWQNHRKRNNSIIVDLFQGQFCSTVMCLTCKKKSVTFEVFMYLSLPIPPGTGAYKLEDCIRLFTREEKVSGNDSWFCSNCCMHREASKKIEIWKLPSILLIHFKRFSFEGMWRQKKQNYVDFPLNSLDMASHVVGIKPSKQYNLYAVSNHYGTMTGGHYTACCINPYKNKFYCFDDNEVRDIAPRQVKTSAAYLLFYTSVNFAAPRISVLS